MISSKHFSHNELKCKCGCEGNEMDADFLTRLECVREDYGIGMYASSSYRCPEHNDRVSSTGLEGPHTTGHAIDIRVCSKDALKVLSFALAHGMTGIGVSQKGARGSRFIHLDDLTDGVRPHIWSY